MLKTLIMKAACIAFVGSIAFAAHAIADTQRFDIPAGDLVAALESFAKQADVNLVYQDEQVKGLRTGGLSGDFSPRDAVTKLLEGTPLHLRTDEASGALLITTQLSSGASSTSGAHERRSNAADPADSTAIPASSWQSSRLDRADAGSSEAVAGETLESSQRRMTVLDEIVVTGSRLGRAEGSVSNAGVSDVHSVERDTIERSGRLDIAGVLNALPEVSVQSPESGRTFGASTTVQLRGLPIGTTLVLLNGRRLPISGSTASNPYFDLNNLPLAAVDRIDVIPAGSSAIYGSDALGGTVNVVLRRDVEGLIAVIQGGGSSKGDTAENSAALMWGARGENWRFSAIANAFERDPLLRQDRELTRDNDYRRFGGPDARFAGCSPGTISSTTSSNLPGLNATFAAVPSGAGAVATIPQFQTTVGQRNLCSFATATEIAGTERLGLLLTGSIDLGENVTVYFDGLGNDLEQETRFGARAFLSRVASAANPFNPFGAPVRIDYAIDRGNGFTTDTKFGYGVAGVRGTVGQWQWDASVLSSGEWTSIRSENINTAALTAALSSADPATALNVFGTGAPGSRELIDSLFTAVTEKFSSRTRSALALLRGDLFTVGSDAVRVALGAEFEETDVHFGSQFQPVSSPFDRTVRSVFAEARIPLLGTSEGAEQSLTMTLAGRNDWYSDFGSAFSPQAGLNYRLASWISLRGGYAESFRAPALQRLYAFPTLLTTIVRDPLRGGVATTIASGRDGNPDLQPETGDSFNVGVVLDPRADGSLTFDAAYWEVHLEDRIGQPTPQQTVDFPDLFPGIIVRGPPTPEDTALGRPGQITILRTTFANFGRTDVRGVDLSVRGSWPMLGGVVTSTLSATRALEYEAALSPAVPAQDRLAFANADGYAPKWKARLALSYDAGDWDVGCAVRYVGEYSDYDGARKLGDLAYVDLTATAEFRLFNQAQGRFTLGVNNVFDQEPDFSNVANGFYGYDASQYDIRGAYGFARLEVRF